MAEHFLLPGPSSGGQGGGRGGGRGGGQAGGRGGVSVGRGGYGGRNKRLTEEQIREKIASLLDESDDDDIDELNGEEDGWCDQEGDSDSDSDDEQVDNQPENDEENVENIDGQDDVDSGDESDGGGHGQEGPTRTKRPRLKDRLVNSLDAALNELNYDPYVAPTDKEVVSAVIEKKKRNVPEKKISWQNQEVARSRAGRPPAAQNRKVAPGVVPNARNAVNPVDCFSLFVTDDMLDDVVKLTNNRIDMLVDSLTPEQLTDMNMTNNYQYTMQHTDTMEIKAFIGLYYIRGLPKENFSDYAILWEDGLGHPIYAATMSRDRFKFLNRVITFDDPNTRPDRVRLDRFALMREFFERWNDRCGTVGWWSTLVTTALLTSVSTRVEIGCHSKPTTQTSLGSTVSTSSV